MDVDQPQPVEEDQDRPLLSGEERDHPLLSEEERDHPLLSEEEQDQAISQFINITGVNPERGKLYLTNTGWNLDLAIASFFEEADETAEELVSQRDQLDEEEAAVAAARTAPNLFAPPEPQASMADSRKEQRAPRRGIATLGSLRNGEENSDDDSDKQAFYAGGSDRSGQQVLGPSKKQDPDKLIKEMFSSAKEHGGQVVDPSESPAGPSRERFAGSGYRLGSEPGEPSQVVAGASNPVPQQPSVDLVLKLWRNGFSVDDGQLRAYDDPSNADFLRSIKMGEIPREVINSARGSEVNLNMEDHRDQDYVMVKKPVKPFAGEGQRLGNVAPVTSAETAMPASPPDIQSAQLLMGLDESRPLTSLQIRLSDGTR